jgi:hypothetical protein
LKLGEGRRQNQEFKFLSNIVLYLMYVLMYVYNVYNLFSVFSFTLFSTLLEIQGGEGHRRKKQRNNVVARQGDKNRRETLTTHHANSSCEVEFCKVELCCAM